MCKLRAHVTQPAETDHANLLAFGDAPVAHGRICCDASAEERCGPGEIEVGGDSQNEVFIDDDAIGVATVGDASEVLVRGVEGERQVGKECTLEYGSFEGDIPKGQYGGGRVSIWDHGDYELEKWTDTEVMVVLHGTKARGRYVLFATGGKNWMIHRMDPVRNGFQPLPGRIAPMLATAGSLPARDEGWAYEIKWDGIRAVVYVDGGRVRALSRTDRDITATFPELREVGERLGARPAVIDGELVALGPDGRPSFGLLQQRMH